jgi:hypothetical protein
VQIISQRSDVQFLKVDFDANKQMCRTLGVKVLPFFHMYRGADGRVAEFSASLSKIQRLRDALDEHGGARCNLEPSSPPALVRAWPQLLGRASASRLRAREELTRALPPLSTRRPQPRELLP